MIYVIGMGPGDGRYALPAAWEKIANCSIIAGYPGLLQSVTGKVPLGCDYIDLSRQSGAGLSAGLQRIDAILAENTDADIAVLVSGDPGFHSLFGTICKKYPQWPIEVIPGLSSFQVACARLNLVWQWHTLISLHHTEQNSSVAEGCEALLGPALQENSDVGLILLTGSLYTPVCIAEYLLEKGLGKRKVWLCYDIGTEREAYIETTVQQVRQERDGLCLMILPRMAL